MQVFKCGNSLAVRLPDYIVDTLELSEGDNIEVTINSNSSLQIARKPNNSNILTKLRKFRGIIPANFKFDRNDANTRS